MGKKRKKGKKEKKDKKRKKKITTRALHGDNDNATAYDKSVSESGKSPEKKKQKVVGPGVVVSSPLVTLTKNPTSTPALPPSVCSSTRTPSNSSTMVRILQGNNVPLKEKSRSAATDDYDVAVAFL